MVEVSSKKLSFFCNGAITKRIENLCYDGIHEYCTLSTEPWEFICLNCGDRVKGLENLTDEEIEVVDKIDKRLLDEKIDLYR